MSFSFVVEGVFFLGVLCSCNGICVCDCDCVVV